MKESYAALALLVVGAVVGYSISIKAQRDSDAERYREGKCVCPAGDALR